MPRAGFRSAIYAACCCVIVCAESAEIRSSAPGDAASLKRAGRRHFDGGRYAQAEASYRMALAASPSGADLPTTLNELGATLIQLGEHDEARTTMLRALEAAERLRGKNHPSLRPYLSNLAVLHRIRLEHPAALRYLRRALELSSSERGEPGVEAAITLHNMAAIYFDMGQLSKARRLLEDSTERLQQAQGSTSVSLVPGLCLLASIAADTGKPTEAAATYSRAADLLVAAKRDGHPAFATVLSDWGTVQAKMGQAAEAQRSFERALTILTAANAQSTDAFALTMYRLAKLHLARKQYGAAIVLYEQANAHTERVYGTDSVGFALRARGYAEALRGSGRKDEARAVEERASAIRRRMPPELSDKHSVDVGTLLANSQ